MGLWGAAQAVAFALGGLVATIGSDLARHLAGTPAGAYAAVFAGEAILFLFAARLAVDVFQMAPARQSAFAASSGPNAALATGRG
jgi:BCD family chlorophyll transporter-like MFS transporter